MHTGPSGKKKKISIRFVPNKTATAKIISHEGKDLYPLYVRIVFNRRNTRFPYIYDVRRLHLIFTDEVAREFYAVNSDDIILYALNPREVEADFAEYRKQLIEIIDYEYKTLGERQAVIGIYSRLLKYNAPLLKVLKEEASEELLDFLEDKLTMKQFKAIQEWEQNRIRLNPKTAHPDDPIALAEYLRQEAQISELPLNIRQTIYSLFILVDFEESNPQSKFTLYNWLIESSLQESLVSYQDQHLGLLEEASSIANTAVMPVKDVVNVLQQVAIRVVDRMYKNIYTS